MYVDTRPARLGMGALAAAGRRHADRTESDRREGAPQQRPACRVREAGFAGDAAAEELRMSRFGAHGGPRLCAANFNGAGHEAIGPMAEDCSAE